ncbi:MAG: hypothetical protein E7254_08575 [Lachnospiraceae bacterium]|nr:hypothetical protein [Lachnospiraceae bacterium]
MFDINKRRIKKLKFIYWAIVVFNVVFIAGVAAPNVYAAGNGYTYGITYKLNKGKISKKVPKSYVSGKGLKLVEPKRTGYTFVGWYKDKKFSKQIKKISKSHIGDVKVYAKWKAKSYKIEYELDGGTNSKYNTSTYKYNKSKKMYSPSKRGNVFKGWYTDKKFKNKIDVIKKNTRGKIVLYSKWKAKTYDISYKLNSGKNNDDNPATYKFGKGAKLKTPERKGYVFEGWYLDKEFNEKISSIGKDVVGDVTLYARWTLEPLNIVSEGNDNMIWTWWYYPQVVSYQGKKDRTYWGFATNEGYCGIAAYDANTEETKKTYLKKAGAVDDHNGLAMTVMDDGKIMCAYAGGHNEDRDIHIRISDKSEDITSFSNDTVLLSSGKTCYSQIIKCNGFYYLFYRVDNNNWALRKSIDGIIWSPENLIVKADMQYYCKFVPTTDEKLIRICMYSNPTSEDPNIRMGFLNVKNDTLYNADRKTTLGKSDVDYTKFDLLIVADKNRTQRMFDVAITDPDKTKILYASFSTSKSSRNSVYRIYDDGLVTDICNGGEPLWNPKYQCGASFIDENRIVVARNEEGYDYVEIYDYDENGLSLSENVYYEMTGDASFRNARPIVDVHGKVIIWHSGYYNQTTYKDFFTSAMIYFVKPEEETETETETETEIETETETVSETEPEVETEIETVVEVETELEA